MLRKKVILRLLSNIILMLTVVSMAGCGSFERLIKVPNKSDSTILNTYNTDLHRRSVHFFNPISLSNQVAELRLEPRAEHLFLIVDQSSAIAHQSRGLETGLNAREMASRFLRTMPNHSYKSSLFISDENSNTRWYELSLNSLTNEINDESVNHLETSQQIKSDSLAGTLDRVTRRIAHINGTSVVVLVTAWSQLDKVVEQALLRMRQRNQYQHGDTPINLNTMSINRKGARSGVCFYTVGVGSRLSRSRLVKPESCGFSIAADKVAQPNDMAHFVRSVLYRGPADTDGDGIYDYRDRCANTPSERMVDYSGCLRFSNSVGGNLK